jgi:DAK2 domain fusion protein YloV
MSRFAEALRQHRDELNSLNVYPVPDGDTGTNMLLTQEAVSKELGRVDHTEFSELSGAITRASLMGARGNSGVILAQVLRGFCERVSVESSESSADGLAVARGLEAASLEAYRAVGRPVEGTVLTVLADAARAAAAVARPHADATLVADAALDAGRASLERTREMLPELRAAGVVDAGAKGMVLLLDALAATLSGREMTVPVGPIGPVAEEEAQGDRIVREIDFPFEVVYLLSAPDEAIPSLRSRLGELGDSLVVVGGDGMFKVHVHTTDPEAAVEVGQQAGNPRGVEVVDLREQVADHCLAGQARSVRVAEEQSTGLVAVADGEGLSQIFRSLGAVVVRGGPGNNPSVGDLLEAIEAAPAPAVLLLPDHENIAPAAHRAADESAKQVFVVPARSVPQGVAAAAAFHPTEDPERNAKAVSEAAEGCSAGEIAIAIREADTPAGQVREGDYLALAEDGVVALGADPVPLAVELVRRLRRPDHELITLFAGLDASDEKADAVERALREAFPDLEVEAHRGGQPGYPYLIGVE